MEKATKQQTKTHNTRLILNTLYENGSLSRADLARITQLTRPTVSSIISDLLQESLISETGIGPSAGGKPPTMLTVDYNSYNLLCLDLGGQQLRGALVNLKGQIVDQVSTKTHLTKRDKALEEVFQLIDSLRTTSKHPVKGIAVGTPGLVDPHTGVVQRAINLGWKDLQLAEILKDRYNTPVWVINDSQATALAEYKFGNINDAANLIAIKVGEGIGAGIVLNGELFYGDGFSAGEIGHLVVEEQGSLCPCGNHGCLETIASTRSILARAQKIAQENPRTRISENTILDWEFIGKVIDNGDPVFAPLLDSTGKAMGKVVASLIASFDVNHIVLSGQISHLGVAWLEIVRNEARKRVLPEMVGRTEMTFSSLEGDRVILGCSAMILQKELGIV